MWSYLFDISFCPKIAHEIFGPYSSSMVIDNNKKYLEATLDAFLCQSNLVQFVSWLNSTEKKGHECFNE